jgi:translation elongation factor EF-Tu-like GTPase
MINIRNSSVLYSSVGVASLVAEGDAILPVVVYGVYIVGAGESTVVRNVTGSAREQTWTNKVGQYSLRPAAVSLPIVRKLCKMAINEMHVHYNCKTHRTTNADAPAHHEHSEYVQRMIKLHFQCF